MPQTTVHVQPARTELISDEVAEIISWKPHWLVRRGNLLLGAVLLSLLILSCFIAYPDVVSGTARLAATNTPKPIAAKGDGRLAKLFAANEQAVKKGQPLGYLETTADYSQVASLQSWINVLIPVSEQRRYDGLVQHPLPHLFNLGELQTPYQELQAQLAETIQILSSGYYQRKKASLHKDMAYLANLRSTTYQQQQLLQQDRLLQQKEYAAYEQLAKEKVIAPLELNQYKSKLLAKEQGLEQITAQLTNSDIASHGKQKELLDLEKSVLDQQQKFHSALLGVKSKVEAWVQQYVFTAPQAGTLFFLQPLQEAENISSGQELFYVQPPQSDVYAQLTIGQRGIGKVRKEQQVLLKLESFPSEEFGHLTGKVAYIAAMPNRKDSFWVTVSLPQGLQTSAKQHIDFRNNLLAQAQIVTDDRTLFNRLVGQLRQLVQR